MRVKNWGSAWLYGSDLGFLITLVRCQMGLKWFESWRFHFRGAHGCQVSQRCWWETSVSFHVGLSTGPLGCPQSMMTRFPGWAIRETGQKLQCFCDIALEVTHHHFCDCKWLKGMHSMRQGSLQPLWRWDLFWHWRRGRACSLCFPQGGGEHSIWVHLQGRWAARLQRLRWHLSMAPSWVVQRSKPLGGPWEVLFRGLLDWNKGAGNYKSKAQH